VAFASPVGVSPVGASGGAGAVSIETAPAHAPTPLAFVPRTDHIVDVLVGRSSVGVVHTLGFPVQIEFVKV
jgi:hypothetical protein